MPDHVAYLNMAVPVQVSACKAAFSVEAYQNDIEGLVKKEVQQQQRSGCNYQKSDCPALCDRLRFNLPHACSPALQHVYEVLRLCWRWLPFARQLAFAAHSRMQQSMPYR